MKNFLTYWYLWGLLLLVIGFLVAKNWNKIFGEKEKDIKAGHGAGKSVAATIQENVDIQAFTFFNMGFMKLPKK